MDISTSEGKKLQPEQKGFKVSCEQTIYYQVPSGKSTSSTAFKTYNQRNPLSCISPQVIKIYFYMKINVVLMQVTNLHTTTTGLRYKSPVVCPACVCELFWLVGEITGQSNSLHVGSCYIWTEDFHKSKDHTWSVCSSRDRLHTFVLGSFGSH